MRDKVSFMSRDISKLSLLIAKEKELFIPIALGLLFIFLLTAILFVNSGPINGWLTALENTSYDLQLRHAYKPLLKDNPIILVDIDDKSIAEEGRWPWPRKKLAELTTQLNALGAKVIVFDLTFPEIEVNIVEEILQESREPIPILETMKAKFDYDELFAESLSQGTCVLGFAFKVQKEEEGVLPPPLMSIAPDLAEQLGIPNLRGYIANIPKLQSAAKNGGFINASPDPDGVLRFSPLLFRRGAVIYPSLALEAVRLFLGNALGEPQLVVQSYNKWPVLEGIQFGSLSVPTDSWGRILIPFRGKPHTFPSVSAKDILNHTVAPEKMQGKLVFIGSSATALGDLFATAITPIFSGVEVHATIASGILDRYFPYKPPWEKGVSIVLVLVLGVFCAVLLPHLGPITASMVAAMIPLVLVGTVYLVWIQNGLVLSFFFPVFAILALYVFNIAYGYLFESRHRRELRTVFGQYVPPTCIDEMLKKGGDFGLEGETKELTVLFTDIRGFTSISERFSAAETKDILNQFLTPMTQVIFDDQGTIDKYVGDMIVAFWGAPLDDPKNAYHSVLAALDMQAKLKELNVVFKAQNKPELNIGIGINTGLMSVGDMGSKFRRAYTVLGDAVNLASRLEGLTKYYHVGVLVGQETQGKTASEFLYRKLDSVRVQGKVQTVAIYEPICERGKETPDLLAKVDLHHRALEAYCRQQWTEAESLFKQLAPSNQSLYAVYLGRIETFRSKPPAPGWDGSYTLEMK